MMKKYGKNQRDMTGTLICTAFFVSLVLAAGCVGTDNAVTVSTTSPSAPPSGWNGQVPDQGMRDNATRIAMNLSSAAAKLGVTEEQLREALGSPGQGQRNMTAVAKQLGVSEQELIAALGSPRERFGNRT